MVSTFDNHARTWSMALAWPIAFLFADRGDGQPGWLGAVVRRLAARS
jgi:hypothetical protein